MEIQFPLQAVSSRLVLVDDQDVFIQGSRAKKIITTFTVSCHEVGILFSKLSPNDS